MQFHLPSCETSQANLPSPHPGTRTFVSSRFSFFMHLNTSRIGLKIFSRSSLPSSLQSLTKWLRDSRTRERSKPPVVRFPRKSEGISSSASSVIPSVMSALRWITSFALSSFCSYPILRANRLFARFNVAYEANFAPSSRSERMA